MVILPAGSAIPQLESPHGRIDCTCGGVVVPATDPEHDVAEYLLWYGCGCAPASIAATIPGYRFGLEYATFNEAVDVTVTPISEGGQ